MVLLHLRGPLGQQGLPVRLGQLGQPDLLDQPVLRARLLRQAVGHP